LLHAYARKSPITLPPVFSDRNKQPAMMKFMRNASAQVKLDSQQQSILCQNFK
jgi:hypothetical protein